MAKLEERNGFKFLKELTIRGPFLAGPPAQHQEGVVSLGLALPLHPDSLDVSTVQGEKDGKVWPFGPNHA